MTRKWLNSADVEVIDGAIAVTATAASAFAGGTKNVAAVAVAEKLVAVPTPCRAVWIGARHDADGAGTNTKCVFIGDAAGQNIPLLPTNVQGLTIAISDASKVYIKAGADGEGVHYRILA